MKLWFFRTPGGRWGCCDMPLNERDMKDVDNGERILDEGMIGVTVYQRKPRWWKRQGFPKLQPGECIPVELVPIENKKARKG